MVGLLPDSHVSFCSCGWADCCSTHLPSSCWHLWLFTFCTCLNNGCWDWPWRCLSSSTPWCECSVRCKVAVRVFQGLRNEMSFYSFWMFFFQSSGCGSSGDFWSSYSLNAQRETVSDINPPSMFPSSPNILKVTQQICSSDVTASTWTLKLSVP